MSKVLIIGISGMLGSAAFNVFARDTNFEVLGTGRNLGVKAYFPPELHGNIITGLDVLDTDSLVKIMGKVKPDVVINCVGLIKQLETANDPLSVLPINSIFPHRLCALCELAGARLIHVSTDCVFDGSTGGYIESDQSNATDLYGKSKYIGEVRNSSSAITLRTSIIGHELNSRHALIDWYLAQTKPIKGYQRAMFSGLPTVELARVIKDFVIPRPNLSGLYHLSAGSISKFDLLSLVSKVYGRGVDVLPDSDFVIDRSLNSKRFQNAFGYKAPSWPDLVKFMKELRGNNQSV
jgi:dTDP-4-dehydrorhamnose reductase